MAALPSLTRAQAAQIILYRQRSPLNQVTDISIALGGGRTGGGFQVPAGFSPALTQVDVKSNYFEIYGQLRLEQHVVRARSVVWRQNQFAPNQVLRRERLAPDAT